MVQTTQQVRQRIRETRRRRGAGASRISLALAASDRKAWGQWFERLFYNA